MKQGQYANPGSLGAAWKSPGGLSESLCYPAHAPRQAARARAGVGFHPARVVGAGVGLVWWILTLPFRILLGLFRLLGRLSGVLLGFTLMVIGMALFAGPLFIVGVPMFIIGLLLTLRCLG
jgi:hypothetical protein